MSKNINPKHFGFFSTTGLPFMLVGIVTLVAAFGSGLAAIAAVSLNVLTITLGGGVMFAWGDVLLALAVAVVSGLALAGLINYAS
jgi:hypothetical protein